MGYQNEMNLKLLAVSENESFARAVVGAFCLPLKPSIDEISDIKTAVSEAVTNCVVHAYKEKRGFVYIQVNLVGQDVYITIKDQGVGIADLELARQPFFTSLKDSERSGMGFTVMEGFMDEVKVESILGKGTTITLRKHIKNPNCAFGG